MLKLAAGTAAAVALLGLPTAAVAEDGPVVVVGDNRDGAVATTVTAGGTPGGNVAAHTSSDSGGTSSVTCSWTELSALASDLFVAVGAGDATGHFYDVKCSDGSIYVAVYVPPTAPNLPPDVALAGTLARRATNTLQLPLPRVRRNPTGDALVGLGTWWWLDRSEWLALRQRTTAGPVFAEVTATPVRSVWDAGDGSALVCSGPGQPYDTSRPAGAQHTDCAHTYQRSSADQPQNGPGGNDRFFTVTVTVYWQITWSGSGGAAGELPEIARTATFPLRVQERQTVVTGGSG